MNSLYSYRAYCTARPTEVLLRQLAANRKAARARRDKYGRMTFPHILPYRPHFVREILAMKAVLRERGVRLPATGHSTEDR